MNTSVRHFGFVLCYLVLALHFPMQLLRHAMATGYGSTFDEPGLGWVCLYSGMMGLLCGSMVALCYWAICAKKMVLSTLLLVVALQLIMPYAWLSDFSNQDDRNRAILRTAHKIFFVPFAAFQPPPKDIPSKDGRYICLPPRSNIRVQGDCSEPLTITSGKGSLRSFYWNGACRSISVKPNYAAREIFYHSSQWHGFDWLENHGSIRCSYYEGFKDFPSESAAIKYIEEISNDAYPMTYTDDGLLIYWSEQIELDTLGVYIEKITVGDKSVKLDPHLRARKSRQT